MKPLLLALALVATPVAAEPLPPDDVEKLLAISADLDRRGYPEAAQQIYDIATDCEFCADDHPKRDPYAEVPEQPWFCEDYEANDEPPFPECIHEPRRERR